MSITLTIIAIIYAVIGFFFHRECLRLKAEDDDVLWEGVDKNDWWVELIFIICSFFAEHKITGFEKVSNRDLGSYLS